MPVSEELREFYASINFERINRFVEEREQENHRLDFKVIGLASGWNALSKEEKGNLARGLSAFANTGGGVLVWGIGASRGKDSIDAASKHQPFPNPGRVLSVLQTQTHVAVDPAVRGVEHELVEAGDGKAYAKTLVPESDGPPHMAKYGDDRYYFRSGDSFVKAEHPQIADMFGRRPHPDLELGVRVFKTSKTSGMQHFHIELGIENRGRGLALYPALFVTWQPKGDYSTNIQVYDARGPGLPRRDARSRRFDLEFAGGVDDAIHHGTYLPVVGFTSHVSLASTGPTKPAGTVVPAFQYKVEIHCAEATPKLYEDTVPPERILKELKLPFWPGKVG